MNSYTQNPISPQGDAAPLAAATGAALYVVSGEQGGMNTRARAMARLTGCFDRLVHVHAGPRETTDTRMLSPAWPNPIAVLGYLGLGNLKQQVDQLVWFPSHHVLFSYAIRRKLVKAIRNDLQAGLKVTVLITSPPHATTQLGLYLKKQVPDIRLVIDWQDLWTYDESYLHRVPKIYRSRLQRLEQRIMQAADVNVATNRAAEEVLRSRFQVAPERAASINHHFVNSDDIRQPPDTPLNLAADAVNLGFLGTLFKPPKVPGEAVLQALDSIAGESPVKLHLMGDVTVTAPETIRTLKHPCVELYRRVPHLEAMRRLAACDALLITLADLPNCKVIMHGKLPHYLALNKPIIALVPDDSFVAEVVRNTGSGVVLSEPEQWPRELQQVIGAMRNGTFAVSRNEQRIAEYDWDNLARQWLSVLNHV